MIGRRLDRWLWILTVLMMIFMTVGCARDDKKGTSTGAGDETTEPAADKTDTDTGTDEVTKEDPAKEEPTKEEPVKEEPVKEEPVKEEPVKEEPVKEEPVKEEPVKEEPVKEEPVKEEPVKEEPVMEPGEGEATKMAPEPPDAVAAGVTPLEVKVPNGLPALPIPDDNPMSVEKVELGKMLYFDKRLSIDGTVSCATCHDPNKAWAEETATSTGIEGKVGGANSPTVINAAYAKAQFWDGRAATLEEQALGPIENPIEMGHNLDKLVPELNAIAGYKERFQKVFQTDVTKEGMAKAIAAFERTVLSGNSPYDKSVAGDESALTDVQKKGMELFKELRCSTCHSGEMFSGYRYYNAGVGMDKDKPDEGRMAVTKEEGDLGKFRVPSLREVANTAPYFHDGSCDSLEKAVALMASGGVANDNLSSVLKQIGTKEVSADDQASIVEFLKAVSGEYPVIDPPTLP